MKAKDVDDFDVVICNYIIYLLTPITDDIIYLFLHITVDDIYDISPIIDDIIYLLP